MPDSTDSYIILKRTSAVRIVRLVSWIMVLLGNAGPNWHRHIDDMRVARAELEDAIDMSNRASERAAAKTVAA